MPHACSTCGSHDCRFPSHSGPDSDRVVQLDSQLATIGKARDLLKSLPSTAERAHALDAVDQLWDARVLELRAGRTDVELVAELAAGLGRRTA